jgi:alkaline phosphatase
VVQSGTGIEPGTAIFLTDAPQRSDYDANRTWLDRVRGAGDSRRRRETLLAEGCEGRARTGRAEGGQKPGRAGAGAAVHGGVHQRELLSLPESNHTFNDLSEEELAAAKLPMYWPDAPTVAEMTDWALRRLSRDGKQFLLVVEEEGTENFGDHNNAAGMLEAMRRGDEAIGVASEFVSKHPDTLLMTAADSDAGGIRLVGLPVLRTRRSRRRLRHGTSTARRRTG